LNHSWFIIALFEYALYDDRKQRKRVTQEKKKEITFSLKEKATLEALLFRQRIEC
jgi:urease accessory protein UreE